MCVSFLHVWTVWIYSFPRLFFVWYENWTWPVISNRDRKRGSNVNKLCTGLYSCKSNLRCLIQCIIKRINKNMFLVVRKKIKAFTFLKWRETKKKKRKSKQKLMHKHKHKHIIHWTKKKFSYILCWRWQGNFYWTWQHKRFLGVRFQSNPFYVCMKKKNTPYYFVLIRKLQLNELNDYCFVDGCIQGRIPVLYFFFHYKNTFCILVTILGGESTRFCLKYYK